MAELTKGCVLSWQNNVNIHAATVRQSHTPRITVHVDWASTAGSFGSGWGNARAGNDEAVAAWQGAREAKATAVPPRLMEDEEWGWLFDSTLPRPLASLCAASAGQRQRRSHC